MSVTLALAPHPASPPTGLDPRVEVAFRPGRVLELRYLLDCGRDRVRLPAPLAGAGPDGRVDGLWRRTCFEAFVADADAPAGAPLPYLEFNFSPSGQWQAYAFRGYRDAGPALAIPAPDIVLTVDARGLILTVRQPMAWPATCRRPRLGLSAVLETADGALSYWALRHPPGPPDFHHPDTFAHVSDLPEDPS